MLNLDQLKSLHITLIDAIKGYDTAIENADSGDVKLVFEQMSATHRQAHQEIDALLTSKGETPDETGSFMATIHKTVIAARSATTGLDFSSLNSFAEGEEHILGAYEKAIEESRNDDALVGVLAAQRDRLRGMIVRLKDESANSRQTP